MKAVHLSRKKRRFRRIFLVISAGLLISAALAGTLALAPYASERMDMSLMDIPEVSTPATLLCYDPAHRASRTGTLHPAPHTTLASPERRVFVPYEDIPPELIHAFVAIEDKRFYRHHGVDILRTLRAAGGYITGRSSFGGSTITQQLVKNLTGHDETTPDRKLREVFLALDLERHASKEEVLETYLNIINLAGGCRGVGAAAERYFSKSAADLTLPECAAIAAITNNPARYDPIAHPEANRARRDLILREMADQGYITPAARDAAIATPLGLHPAVTDDAQKSAEVEADASLYNNDSGVPSWYADLVAADVIRDLCDRLGCTRAHASMLLYSGGLTIECAMDEELQGIVEAYYADPARFPIGTAGRPQSSFILIDPATGDILAVAGAIGEKSAARIQNYATDTRRPAGSCIKPLSVYAPALRRGRITWATLCDDAPIGERNGVPWPANADGVYRGQVLVGEAVAESLNTVAVRLVEEMGVSETLHMLRDDFGLNSLILPGSGAHDATLASLALGQQAYGITSRELTAAYTAFYDGIRRPAISYHRVLDREGKVLLEQPAPAASGTRVLSPEIASVMTHLLMGVTDHGTAASVTLTDTLGIECAGKTGTTQQNCDRRFVGYTPRLLAGVWMGYDYPVPLDGIAGNPCIRIWDELMLACEQAYRGTPMTAAFPIPDAVIPVDICSLTGMAVNPWCADPEATLTGDACPPSFTALRIEQGWFVRGTEPRSICSAHGEPPISIQPLDPTDPERIPALPNDLVPWEDREVPSRREPSSPGSRGGWISRWFRRHAG